MIYLDTKKLPRFRKGWDYIELPARGKWRFMLISDVTITGDTGVTKKLALLDQAGVERGAITPWSITLCSGYAWNGCSPKVALFGRWFGTPDPRSTILASGIHDLLFQFSACKGFPFDMEECNDLFADLIHLAGDPWTAAVYGAAVNSFGRMFWSKDSGCRIEEVVTG